MTRTTNAEIDISQPDEPVILIDPTNLTLEQSIFLKEFLESEDQSEIIIDDAVYKFDEIQFKLTHEINCRLRKDGINDCFEVMKNSQAGSGRYATVDHTVGKLVINGSALDFIPASAKPHKERVRKLIFFKQDKPEEVWHASVKEEYKRTKQAGHLNIKKPVFTLDNSGRLCAYFFLKKASGPTLYDILKGTAQIQLDTATRKAISIAIINAYIEQVENRGLVHNDISLKNIMVDLTNPKQPIVTFIDFAFAKKIAKNDAGTLLRGTPAYMAPERMLGKGSSTASDVFALGHILGELLGEQRIKPDPKLGLRGVLKLNQTGKFESELIYLDESEREIMTPKLEPMLSPDPIERPTLEQVKRIFTADNASLFESVADSELSASTTESMNI
jgi:serine/threonine protein kinase